MGNADTQHLIDLVERQTGYRVTVDVISGIYEHAQMISARPGTPAHVIRVNADYRQHADYIVAVQCGMLLVLWSDPTKVPGMAFEKSKCGYLADKWAKTKPLADREGFGVGSPECLCPPEPGRTSGQGVPAASASGSRTGCPADA